MTGVADPPTAAVGEQITYTLKVYDQNGGPAPDMHVRVELPAQVSLVSSYADRGPGCTSVAAGVLDCNLDYLSGDSMTGHIVLVVRVEATGLLTLRATATYLFADPTPADNTAVVLANQPVAALPAPPAPAPVLRPVIGQATITPAAAAGRHVSVSFQVTRSDNPQPLTRGGWS